MYLSDEEKDRMKEILNWTTTREDQQFQERLAVQLKSQEEPIKFIAKLLKDIHREDLCYHLL